MGKVEEYESLDNEPVLHLELICEVGVGRDRERNLIIFHKNASEPALYKYTSVSLDLLVKTWKFWEWETIFDILAIIKKRPILLPR